MTTSTIIRTALLGTMGALAAGTMAIGTANAQDRYYYDAYGQPVEASYDSSVDDGITVSGEPVYRHQRGRFDDTLTTHQRVSTRDLDLNYSADREVLHSRVAYAADLACDRLDRASRSMDYSNSNECRRDARASARGQVRAAIRDASYRNWDRANGYGW